MTEQRISFSEKLKWGRFTFRLDLRKKLFMTRLVSHWMFWVPHHGKYSQSAWAGL